MSHERVVRHLVYVASLFERTGGGARRYPFMEMQDRCVEIGEEGSLSFWEKSGGAPVILIHGAFTTRCDWPEALLSGLTGRRILAIDRPGHGRSARPRYGAAPRKQAEQIRKALKLNEPAIIIAHSFGGMTALAYAEQYPEEVSALLLLSPVCFPEFRPVENLLLGPTALPVFGPIFAQGSWPLLRSVYLPFIHHQMFAPQAVPQAWKARYPYEQIALPSHFVEEGEDTSALSPFFPDAYLDIKSITAPISVIAGSADRIVNHALHAKRLTVLTGARVLEAPELGHMLHHFAENLVLSEFRRLAEETSAGSSSGSPSGAPPLVTRNAAS